MRISLLVLAAAACAKPLSGQLRFRQSENETAPAVSDNSVIDAIPSSANRPATNGTLTSPSSSNGAQAAAALNALVKRRLPAR